MVPKHFQSTIANLYGFRAVLFRMVPKPARTKIVEDDCFRAVLFRMVPSMWDT